MLSVYKSSTKLTINSGSCKLWTIYNIHYQYASNYLKFTSFGQRCIIYGRSPFRLDDTSKDCFPNNDQCRKFLFSGNINYRKTSCLGSTNITIYHLIGASICHITIRHGIKCCDDTTSQTNQQRQDLAANICVCLFRGLGS
jgi:hypothetical protein